MMSTEVSIKDAAAQLKISEQRARTLCRQGLLEARKIGNSWTILQKSIDTYGLVSGHIIAEDRPAYNISAIARKPIALSFFSGAMGLDVGIEKAGFHVRLACEVDKYCRQTRALNRRATALLGERTAHTDDGGRSAGGPT